MSCTIAMKLTLEVDSKIIGFLGARIGIGDTIYKLDSKDYLVTLPTRVRLIFPRLLLVRSRVISVDNSMNEVVVKVLLPLKTRVFARLLVHLIAYLILLYPVYGKINTWLFFYSIFLYILSLISILAQEIIIKTVSNH